MVVGEPAADLLRHQRIDRRKAATDEQDAASGAEQVVGVEEDSATEQRGETACHEHNAVPQARQNRLHGDPPHQQGEPVQRQQPQ